MKLIDLLFPILKTFNAIFFIRNQTDVISQNNYELAQELKNKPPMPSLEIKEYHN